MNRLEHALGLVKYYQQREEKQDSSTEWRKQGARVADWYLELVNNESVTMQQVDELIAHITKYSSEFGGSAWHELLMDLNHWKDELKKN